ncbi:unnamed protein product [Gongylonema pulchrum]|uniref:Autophagy-related protein 2 n=1 Tax=Gongylonema pulchrum TaxID=637853 RepID=A0A3P7N1A4_9BILA|nr:unnamed protein product [Gongylonema pulchrum]
MESARMPFTAVEGYIGKVTIRVPWHNIFASSVDLEVEDLQLTLQLQQIPVDEPSNVLLYLVASMLESVVGSTTTSMELAQNFLKRDELIDEAEDKGVERFAEAIDAIISRFRLIFTDATIRLEDDTDLESGLCTALELRIDWLELIDEQLESESCSGETITAEPHSLSAVPDFNKLFHVKGMRLYTDIFTKPEQRDLSEGSASSLSQIITSMYLRREKERKKPPASSNSSPEQWDKSSGVSYSMHSTTASTIYESCYSHQNCMDDELPSSASSLESNPVLLASLSGGVDTVIVREINISVDSLCVFLTPSQLCILKTFFDAFTRNSFNLEETRYAMGRPMSAKDYQQVEAELQTRIMSSSGQVNADFQHGNWGGSMMFYDAQRRPSAAPSGEPMANISLNFSDSDPAAGGSREFLKSNFSSSSLSDSEAVMCDWNAVSSLN